ncbi:MAG: STAS domain-containing protein [Brevinematales bacterium]|nr:STAS domain-containing protein [Brevinematales bacterium]
MTNANKRILFRIRGNATIERTSALKNSLLKLLNDSTIESLQIEGSEIAAADLSFLQVIVSACRSFARAGKRLEVVNPSPALSHTMELSGITHLVHCGDCPMKSCTLLNPARKEGV